MARFQDAIEYVLANEGIDSNDPNDRGKRTRYGITAETAANYGYDVATLTLDDAKAIYDAHYWRFDGVADQSVATKLLDMAVNLGPRQAAKLAQRAAGVAADGIWGPMTVAAINTLTPDMALEKLSLALSDFYVDLCLKDRTQLSFLKGWERRCIRRPTIR